MFLSIITVNYNNNIELKKTLKSITEQSSDDFEHIIIDGGSTDGSVDTINLFLQDSNYASKVGFWCSEKDSGIYNAMNKGIQHAVGDYILFLNSGDYFINSKIIEKIKCEELNADIIYFDALCSFEKGSVTMKYPDVITPSFFYGYRTLNHQNTLIKTSIHKNRHYKENYKIAADMDFFFEKIIINNCSTQHYDFPIVFYDGINGISSKKDNLEIRKNEMRNSIKSYLSDMYLKDLDYLYSLEEELNEYKYRWKGILFKLKKILDTYSRIKNKK